MVNAWMSRKQSFAHSVANTKQDIDFSSSVEYFGIDVIHVMVVCKKIQTKIINFDRNEFHYHFQLLEMISTALELFTRSFLASEKISESPSSYNRGLRSFRFAYLSSQSQCKLSSCLNELFPQVWFQEKELLRCWTEVCKSQLHFQILQKLRQLGSVAFLLPNVSLEGIDL